MPLPNPTMDLERADDHASKAEHALRRAQAHPSGRVEQALEAIAHASLANFYLDRSR